MDTILFYAFSLKMLAAATMSLIFKNNINRALSLVVCFFSAAILAIMINAEFIATMLVVVYMGAIAMLFLFVIITIGDNEKDGSKKGKTPYLKKISTFLCVVFLAIFAFISLSHICSSGASFDSSEKALFSTKDIGDFLYNSQYSTIIYCGFILFIALVAAVVIAIEYKFKLKNQTIRKPNASSKAKLIKKENNKGEAIL